MSNPYCIFNHGKMLKTRGKLSKIDGGLRQYYHCRNSSCSYSALEPRFDAKFFKEMGDDYYEKKSLEFEGNDVMHLACSNYPNCDTEGCGEH
jgi:hypothetical protein